MANWFCSVFIVVCVVNVCRSELIDSAWVVIVPGQKCIKNRKKMVYWDGGREGCRGKCYIYTSYSVLFYPHHPKVIIRLMTNCIHPFRVDSF